MSVIGITKITAHLCRCQAKNYGTAEKNAGPPDIVDVPPLRANILSGDQGSAGRVRLTNPDDRSRPKEKRRRIRIPDAASKNYPWTGLRCHSGCQEPAVGSLPDRAAGSSAVQGSAGHSLAANRYSLPYTRQFTARCSQPNFDFAGPCDKLERIACDSNSCRTTS